MMAAVHLISLQVKENKKKGMTDTGQCETPPASSTPVQIHIENEKQHNVCQSVFCFFLSTRMNGNAYIHIFHTATNQASDHNLILILYYSHIKDCCPMQSQTSSWSLIAIKSILCRDKKKKKSRQHTNIDPSNLVEKFQTF